MALTKDRDTVQRDGDIFVYDVAANAKLFAGGIAVINAAGFAEPGSQSVGLKVAGRIEEQADNTGGADGDVSVSIRKGCFKLKNSAVNPITTAHILNHCYIEDDETVGSLATGMSVGGTIMQVDSDGVWITIT